MGEHQKVFNALFHQPAQMRRYYLPFIWVFYVNYLIYFFFFECASGCSPAVSLTI